MRNSGLCVGGRVPSALCPGVDLLLRGFNTWTLASHPVTLHTHSHTHKVNAEVVCCASGGFNPFPDKHFPDSNLSFSNLPLCRFRKLYYQYAPTMPFFFSSKQLESCIAINAALMCFSGTVAFSLSVFCAAYSCVSHTLQPLTVLSVSCQYLYHALTASH